MSSTFGRLFRVTTFGESHGPALGGIVDGFPAGIRIDMDRVLSDMSRRRPGSTSLGTKRSEDDIPRILSGVMDGVSTGAPIAFAVENKAQISSHYDEIAHTFRPGHADYSFWAKYGIRDWRGGGRSSGRETLSRCFAGALAKQLLAMKGISVDAGVIAIGGISASSYSWEPPFANELYAPECPELEAMRAEVEKAREEGNSVGGIIECRARGMVPGLGDPVFDKADAILAMAVMSIGGIKGVEFGSGFGAAAMKGSANNDQMSGGRFLSNNAGGILGGITTGEDIIIRAAAKPTPSISISQMTMDEEGNDTPISVRGRHDPCIAIRASVVVEAMAAIALADMMLIKEAYSG